MKLQKSASCAATMMTSAADEFDSAPLEIKRTILSQLIDRVEVGRKYAVTIKFNMSYQQFLECDKTIEPNQEIGA